MPGQTGDTWVDWNGAQYYTRNLTISANTWNTWNQTFTNSTALLTRYDQAPMTYDLAWTSWNQRYTTTTNTYTIRQNNWETWVSVGPNIMIAPRTVGDVQRRFEAPAVIRTEEEWTAIREEQDRQRRLRDAAQQGARAEARKLMAVVLSKEQLDSYEKLGYFEVVGSEGGVFRIYHGTSGNLKQVVDGREVNALCVHPQLWDGQGYLPTEDSMIAQAFALMHDELGTVQVANVHRGPRHLRAVPEAA